MNYSTDDSHSHGWAQGGKPACGQPLSAHTDMLLVWGKEINMKKFELDESTTYRRKINFLKNHREGWLARQVGVCAECKLPLEDCECVL